LFRDRKFVVCTFSCAASMGGESVTNKTGYSNISTLYPNNAVTGLINKTFFKLKLKIERGDRQRACLQLVFGKQKMSCYTAAIKYSLHQYVISHNEITPPLHASLCSSVFVANLSNGFNSFKPNYRR
jgi:hypothetical protein